MAKAKLSVATRLKLAEIYQHTVLRLQESGIKIPYPDPLPDGVRCIESSDVGRFYRVQKGKCRGLLVGASVAIEADGKLWYHVSYSRRDAMPDYHDGVWVKETFIGADRWAISVMPERSHHVSFHPNCLHWWHCLEGKPIPEFSKAGMI